MLPSRHYLSSGRKYGKIENYAEIGKIVLLADFSTPSHATGVQSQNVGLKAQRKTLDGTNARPATTSNAAHVEINHRVAWINVWTNEINPVVASTLAISWLLDLFLVEDEIAIRAASRRPAMQCRPANWPSRRRWRPPPVPFR
jgi:hypothetical protein